MAGRKEKRNIITTIPGRDIRRKMTPEQALQVLDQAASRALLPREDHYRVQVAVETLKAVIEKNIELSVSKPEGE